MKNRDKKGRFRQAVLEDDNTEAGIIMNLLYDAEWCDLDNEEQSVAFIKSKYIITRNPEYNAHQL